MTINYTKDYFISAMDGVFDRIFCYLLVGNVDVYLDYISGDNIVFMAFNIVISINSLNEYKYIFPVYLKRILINMVKRNID